MGIKYDGPRELPAGEARSLHPLWGIFPSSPLLETPSRLHEAIDIERSPRKSNLLACAIRIGLARSLNPWEQRP